MDNREAAEMIRNDMKLHHDSLSGGYRKALSMAISALQAQDSPKPTAESVQNVQNEDLISRKEAIDSLDSFILDETTNLQGDSVREILESLPSAQPEPHWIPVSERLPDDLGDYLVSIKRIGWNMEEYVENDIAYWDDLEGFHKADEVIAWMPLPEPYRAERRTDEGD